MPQREYDFLVYILGSRSRQLYVGFTNALAIRLRQHLEHRPGTYTARYKFDRLVYTNTTSTCSTRSLAKRTSKPGIAQEKSL